MIDIEKIFNSRGSNFLYVVYKLPLPTALSTQSGWVLLGDTTATSLIELIIKWLNRQAINDFS
jgi:hypothetical protein